MTTPDYSDDVYRLRRMIGEVNAATSYYTDAELEYLVDTAAEINDARRLEVAALGIWYEKMAMYASLSDIVESGAERKLSQLYRNAQGQVQVYEQKVGDLINPAANLTAARVAGRSTKVWGQEEVTKVLYGSLGARA